jgi:serine/threonine-protein kinase RsbT
MHADALHIPIRTDTDIVEARLAARALASQIGFTGGDLVLIATAVSEIARNIVEYARPGQMVMSRVQQAGRRGLMIVAKDAGPGIRDVSKALEEGYTTARGLGMGLPGARRLMDEFEINSKLGRGTTVIMKKWMR